MKSLSSKPKSKPKPRKKTRNKKNGILAHLKSLGFTNRLAIYILMFLAAGLVCGFYLAIKSISTGYTGSLLCWTIVFTPIGTATSIAISRAVDKSKAENVSGNGDGIKYALMVKQNQAQQDNDDRSWESPRI